jgi:lipoprotein-anchoring transpeptidase ErfK/SrfK
MSRHRRLVVIAGGVMVVGVAILLTSLATGNSSEHTPAAHPAGVPATTSATPPTTNSRIASAVKPQSAVTGRKQATTVPLPSPVAAPTGSRPPAVPLESLVATIPPGGAPGSQMPGGPPTLEVPGQWLGAASVLPVIAQQPGWVEVRLAQRPNQSTAWVPASEVSLATDPYHIIIDLGTMHLQLFNEGQEIANFPTGIGVPADPTPTGSFFVALFAQAPSPGYGPFVIVTSAHSNAISDWEASGDAITAIHGSLGSDAAIGTTGAMVSHGCVRLHNVDLAQLRGVPAGTLIDIVA